MPARNALGSLMNFCHCNSRKVLEKKDFLRVPLSRVGIHDAERAEYLPFGHDHRNREKGADVEILNCRVFCQTHICLSILHMEWAADFGNVRGEGMRQGSLTLRGPWLREADATLKELPTFIKQSDE